MMKKSIRRTPYQITIQDLSNWP